MQIKNALLLLIGEDNELKSRYMIVGTNYSI